MWCFCSKLTFCIINFEWKCLWALSKLWIVKYLHWIVLTTCYSKMILANEQWYFFLFCSFCDISLLIIQWKYFIFQHWLDNTKSIKKQVKSKCSFHFLFGSHIEHTGDTESWNGVGGSVLWGMTKTQHGAAQCLMTSSLCSSHYFSLMSLIKHVRGSLIIV